MRLGSSVLIADATRALAIIRRKKPDPIPRW